MNRKTALFLILSAGFCAARGWSQGDYSDEPQGLRYGPLTLHPSLDLSVGYDSNPQYAKTNVKGLTELRIQPMLDLAVKGDGWGINGRGWLLYDWYMGASSSTQQRIADQDHYGETLEAYVVSPRETRLAISEFYEYQDRANSVTESGSSGNFYNGSFQDRQNLSIGTTLVTPITEKTRVNVGLSYADLWYASTNLFGYDTYSAQAGVARQINAQTDWRLDGGYDIQHSEGSQNNSQGWRLLTGVGSSPTAKSSYRIEGGVMGFDYDNSQASSMGWTYDVSGNWLVSRKLTLHLVGTSDYQPSETDANDYTEVQSIMAGFDYQLTRRLTDTFNGGYRREDYKRAYEADAEHRRDNQFLVYDRLSYRLHRNVNLFIGVEYTRNQSSISDDDYNRLFLNAGMNLHF